MILIFTLLSLSNCHLLTSFTLSQHTYQPLSYSPPSHSYHLPYAHVCSTFPHCYKDQATGLWYPVWAIFQTPEIDSKFSSFRDLSSEKCWFKDLYCAPSADEGAKSVAAEDPEECNKKCKEEDSCNFFTFLKIRGNPICNLLTHCSAKTLCPSTQDCASGADT